MYVFAVLLFGTEDSVAGIAQSGEDVVSFIQTFIE